jgi:uncharacterized membrane protein
MDFHHLGFQTLANAVNDHPAFVHFPLALIPAALALFLAGRLFKMPSLLGGACWVLGLAAVSCLVALVTGLKASNSFPRNAPIQEILGSHMSLGIAVTAATLALAVWSFVRWNRRPSVPFLLWLGIDAVFVLMQGDLGSRMVFEYGAAVKPMIQELQRASVDDPTLGTPHLTEPPRVDKDPVTGLEERKAVSPRPPEKSR